MPEPVGDISYSKHHVHLIPSKVWFITKICHPDISSVRGGTYLDIFKNQWMVAMTFCMLLSLPTLLAATEPNDPQDAVVANQYKQNQEICRQTA